MGRDIYHCFRCDAAGPLTRIFVDEVLSLEQQRQELLDQRKEQFRKEVEEKNIELIPDEAVPFSTLNDDHPAVIYMNDRDVHIPIELLYIQAYTRKRENGHHAYYGSRLIFPVYMDATYQGFQARTTGNHPTKYVN